MQKKQRWHLNEVGDHVQEMQEKKRTKLKNIIQYIHPVIAHFPK